MRNAWISANRLFLLLVCIIFFSTIPTAAAQTASPVSGADVYQKRCAACHDQPGNRAPSRDAWQKMPAVRSLPTLDFGLMMGIAYPIKREEREAVANYLGTPGGEPPPPASSFCAAGMRPMSGVAKDTWAGWRPSPLNTRYQTAEQAGLTMKQVRHLKLKWALGFPGDITAFAAPNDLNGTLFARSAGGAILPVRNGAAYSGVFGDLIGWVYSLDAKTGKELWKRRVEDHEATRLTGSAVAQNGVVYIPAASWEETRSVDPQYKCCTFRGSLTALRVADGSEVWKSYMVDAPKQTGVNSAGAEQWGPSGSPIWSIPTIDSKLGLLYVTTGDNYSSPATATSDAVMALDMQTGRIVWSQQTISNDAYTSACRSKGVNCPAENGPDYDFGSSALLVHAP